MRDDDIIAGFRFRDLLEANIVTSRTDLARKQADHGFPMPVKFGGVAAFFPKTEVNAWTRAQIARRDAAPAKKPAVKKLKLPPSATRKPTAPLPLPATLAKSRR